MFAECREEKGMEKKKIETSNTVLGHGVGNLPTTFPDPDTTDARKDIECFQLAFGRFKYTGGGETVQ